MNKVQIIILAGGQGKRMNSECPKALLDLNGKAFIEHLLETVKESGFCDKPIIVVGAKSDQMISALGDKYDYVFQKERLGTGHAVLQTKTKIGNKAENVLVLYADQPNTSAKTIKSLIKTHTYSNSIITMTTTIVSDFKEWRNNFYCFGRIIRDEKGKIIKIIEKKDATQEQLQIKELNAAHLCFNTKWLWENIEKINNNNAQNEYYLPELIEIAFAQNKKITTIVIDPKEALGVNTPEHLECIKNLCQINEFK